MRITAYTWRHRIQLILVYVCVFGATALAIAIPRLLGIAIDTALGSGNTARLLGLAGLVLLVSVVRGAFAYGQTYLAESVSQKVAYDLRNTFLKKLQSISFAFHDHQKTGDLMSMGTYDVESIRWFIQGGLIRLVHMVALIVGIAALLLITNWKLGLLGLAVVPPAVLLTTNISRRMRRLWVEIQDETGRLTTVLQENLAGMRVVKAFGAEEHEQTRYSQRALKVREQTFQAARLNAVISASLLLLFTGVVGLVLWFGGRQVMAADLTPGELTQFILFLGLLAVPVRSMGFVVNSFTRAIPSGNRLFGVLDTPSPIQEKPNARVLKQATGHVKFENVNFSYNSSESALKDINFEVQPGQKIALVGGPGSGKSTIVQLLPRFYDVDSGHVLIDDVDVQEYMLESLRRNVGIVFQDVFIFSATVKDNIAYGTETASMEKIIAAAKAAQLHDFIVSLPEGYDTWIGERGVNLSGGQRQRLAISRTLLLDPPILVLDDSTSSVDAGTEHLIQKALKTVMKRRTTFIIAHRISSLRAADIILVLHEGRIVERGTHDELLKRGGLYRTIYNLQLLPQEEIALESLAGDTGDA